MLIGSSLEVRFELFYRNINICGTPAKQKRTLSETLECTLIMNSADVFQSTQGTVALPQARCQYRENTREKKLLHVTVFHHLGLELWFRRVGLGFLLIGVERVGVEFWFLIKVGECWSWGWNNCWGELVGISIWKI